MTTDTIVIRAPAGTKARWVRSAHPGKLGPWIVKMIDETPDPDRYLLRSRRQQNHDQPDA